MDSSEFFNTQGIPKPGAIINWLGELDKVVSDLWALLQSTWGGSPRGTEINGILYANHPQNTHNLVILNGLPSIFTQYSKTQHNQGHGNGIVWTPAYPIARILILVLALPFWAAAHLGCCSGMSKSSYQIPHSIRLLLPGTYDSNEGTTNSGINVPLFPHRTASHRTVHLVYKGKFRNEEWNGMDWKVPDRL
ncbi:hypothetical protein F5890DRAFT_1478710 [Lentinula detonsa]|uniref:Uncharacterized protein n=1 Tax=Lentinula detonsa TaxID=2804962 RepID=A0AA38ULX2_9AGAR|nr:hypothetical protein F5890DRAFT_1478710 [Lentinula detonsa]